MHLSQVERRSSKRRLKGRRQWKRTSGSLADTRAVDITALLLVAKPRATHRASWFLFRLAINRSIVTFFLSFFLFSLYDLSPLYSFFFFSFSSFMTIVLRQQRTLSIVKDVLFIIIIISERSFNIQLFHE